MSVVLDCDWAIDKGRGPSAYGREYEWQVYERDIREFLESEGLGHLKLSAFDSENAVTVIRKWVSEPIDRPNAWAREMTARLVEAFSK